MQIGLKHTSTIVVSVVNSAKSIGSGDLEVFSSPSMIALMENAAMLAVANDIPEDSTTVGAAMNSSHIRPSAIGETITATAELTDIEGRKLTFKIYAEDSKGLIGEGTHIRYIVNREKFMSKL